MKNNIDIKEKKIRTNQEKNNIFLSILFSALSLGLGFLVAFFGKGKSYIENELITAIITLFGFGLTATVFVYQAFEKKQSTEKTNNMIKALSKTLHLTLWLIVSSLVFDFIADSLTSEANIIIIIAKTLKYSSLIYSIICQFDILNSFTIIINKNKKDDNENQ